MNGPRPHALSKGEGISLRVNVEDADRATVREISTSTRFFRPDEVDVAVELVEERLAKGSASGYHFVFATQEGRTIGYAIYGQIACTIGSFDLYWIVVNDAQRGQGVGQMLVAEVERLVNLQQGTQIYIDTSGREQYTPTRAFYEKCGYEKAAVLPDFYAPGDDKVIYIKRLNK